jgi:hypothetical protein
MKNVKNKIIKKLIESKKKKSNKFITINIIKLYLKSQKN